MQSHTHTHARTHAHTHTHTLNGKIMVSFIELQVCLYMNTVYI